MQENEDISLLEADPTLHEIVARLVRAIDPDKLVLFGSRAGGGARPDSDYDLLIVKEESDPRQRRTGPLYHRLSGIPGAVDLLWFMKKKGPDNLGALRI